MEIHESPLVETDDPLDVCQRNQTQLETRTDRLTLIGSAELLEDVVEVRLYRRRPEAKVLGKALGSVPFGDTSKNLHLTRCQRYLCSRHDGRRLGNPLQNLWDHPPRNRALAPKGRE